MCKVQCSGTSVRWWTSSLAPKTTLRKEITYREMCLDDKRTIRNHFPCTRYVYKLVKSRGRGALTCLTSILREEAAKFTVFFSGRPSHSMKSLSRLTSCQHSKDVALFLVFLSFSSPFVSRSDPKLDRKCM